MPASRHYLLPPLLPLIPWGAERQKIENFPPLINFLQIRVKPKSALAVNKVPSAYYSVYSVRD